MNKLTVVVATINRPSLYAAIASVARQTVPCNLLVVDDVDRVGAGLTRNSVAKDIVTPWVGFLDDDDTLDVRYAEWLEEEAGDNDVVVFRMRYEQNVWWIPQGTVLPSYEDPELRHANVGISFAMKTELFQTHPFVREGRPPGSEPSEDWILLSSLIEEGAKVHLSERIAYYVRG